jgi:hypothetical protein
MPEQPTRRGWRRLFRRRAIETPAALEAVPAEEEARGPRRPRPCVACRTLHCGAGERCMRCQGRVCPAHTAAWVCGCPKEPDEETCGRTACRRWSARQRRVEPRRARIVSIGRGKAR